MRGAGAASASAMRRRSRADLPPWVAAKAENSTASSSETRSEIRAMHSNPNCDVIHRWREAYPALESANPSTPSTLVQTNRLASESSGVAAGEVQSDRRLMRRIPPGMTQPSSRILVLHERRARGSAILAPSMWTAAFQQPPASLQRCGGRVRPPAAALTRHPSDGKSAPPAHQL